MAQKRYSEAIRLLEGPNQSMFSQAWLTVLYWRTNNASMAWQAFHKAFYKKGKLDVHPGLQRFLAVNGETDGAMQATAPIYIRDHINADEVSRVGDEIELLDEADAFVPNNPYIAYRKGETYFNAQRYKDALLYLQAAKPRMKSYHEVYSCECMPYECNRCLAGNQGGS